jgi:hypothetical protein
VNAISTSTVALQPLQYLLSSRSYVTLTHASLHANTTIDTAITCAGRGLLYTSALTATDRTSLSTELAS